MRAFKKTRLIYITIIESNHDKIPTLHMLGVQYRDGQYFECCPLSDTQSPAYHDNVTDGSFCRPMVKI